MASSNEHDHATVLVEHNQRGSWDVALPDTHERITCGTFEDARRLAIRRAAGVRPCELIVQDAYHRVVQHEHINGRSRASGRRARASLDS
jgi:hypothetical protein